MLSGNGFHPLNDLQKLLAKIPQDHYARVAFETDGTVLTELSVENVPIWHKPPPPDIRPKIVKRKRSRNE